MKRIFTLLFVLGFVQISSAQYDDWSFAEVHLKDNTVLKGQARIPMIPAKSSIPFASKEKLRFRTDSKGSKKIDPKDIKKVIFNVKPDKSVKTKRVVKGPPKTFIIINKNAKKTRLGFAELIVDGKIKLVKRTVILNSARGNRMSVINESLLIKEDNMAIPFNYAELKSFKKRASEYFKDCPDLVKKIINKVFKKEDLKEIVKYYNNSCN